MSGWKRKAACVASGILVNVSYDDFKVTAVPEPVLACAGVMGGVVVFLRRRSCRGQAAPAR
ncbi:MAG: hypothetical protein WBD40_24955 [Tepidisphaeraceae bacterium]